MFSQNHFRTTKLMLFIATFIIFTLSLSVPLLCFGETEGSIGVSYNQIIDDKSGGFVGDFKHDLNGLSFEADGKLQFGDIYRGKLRTAVIFDVGPVGAKVQAENTFKGYTINTLGRNQDITVGLTVPVGNLNFDVGIGGTNSAPWAPPNAHDELEAKGYDVAVLEALDLANVHPKPRGIPFQSGNFLSVFAATGLDVGRIDVDLKGIVQVAGDADKLHQLQSYFQTNYNIYGNFTATVGLEIALSHYQETFHYETALLSNLNYPF